MIGFHLPKSLYSIDFRLIVNLLVVLRAQVDKVRVFIVLPLRKIFCSTRAVGGFADDVGDLTRNNRPLHHSDVLHERVAATQESTSVAGRQQQNPLLLDRDFHLTPACVLELSRRSCKLPVYSE